MKKEGKIHLFKKGKAGEKSVKTVESYEFLTVSTGLSTGGKISDNNCFGIHKTFCYFSPVPNF